MCLLDIMYYYFYFIFVRINFIIITKHIIIAIISMSDLSKRLVEKFTNRYLPNLIEELNVINVFYVSG